MQVKWETKALGAHTYINGVKNESQMIFLWE